MKKNVEKFTIQTKTGAYRVVVWYDKRDKAYLVKVPSLPDVVTFGTSIADAKRMAKDAIELYCECEIAEGKIIIDDKGQVVGKLPKSRVLTLAK